MSKNALAEGQWWRRAVSVLANRDFVLLWIGGGLGSLSSAILTIALTKLVYDQTASASGVGLLVFTNWFSMVVVTPLGGVLADQLDRKAVLVGAGVLSAVLAVLFVWFRAPLAAYVLNFCLASISTLSFAAKSALVPDIAQEGQLLDTNALQQSLGTLVSIVGPLFGGFIIDRSLPVVAFTLCGALYLASALSRLFIRVPRQLMLQGAATLRGVYEGFVEGVQYARGNRVVATLIIVFLMVGTGYGLVLGLDIVFAEQALSGSLLPTATAYSYMVSALSFGTFVGSLLVRYLGRRFAKKRLLIVGLSTLGLESLALAFVRSLPLTLTVKFGRGIGTGINMSLWPTLLQENVEQEKRGRAISLFFGVASITPSVTIYLGSWLADQTSVQTVYGLAGGCILLAVFVGCLLPGFRAIPARVEHRATKATS